MPELVLASIVSAVGLLVVTLGKVWLQSHLKHRRHRPTTGGEAPRARQTTQTVATTLVDLLSSLVRAAGVALPLLHGLAMLGSLDGSMGDMERSARLMAGTVALLVASVLLAFDVSDPRKRPDPSEDERRPGKEQGRARVELAEDGEQAVRQALTNDGSKTRPREAAQHDGERK